MRQNYRIRAVNLDGSAALDVTLHCAQTQINKALYSLAYCMANDGGWDNVTLFLEKRTVRETLSSINFKH